MKKRLIYILFAMIPCFCFAQADLKTFIPVGYALLDSASGDMNKDGIRDVVLILKKKNEGTQNDVERPLLILHGSKGKKYVLAAKNNKVVLCASCGGVFGDPYDKLVIKNNYFSVEHYGGSNWRWTRIMTFKYDLKRKLYMLHRDAGISYHTSDPDKTTETVHSKKDFDKLLFTEYNNAVE
jgi:hypothetical protein